MHFELDSPRVAILAASPPGAALTWLLTGLMRGYALAAQLLTKPNDRSMHLLPTPRGERGRLCGERVFGRAGSMSKRLEGWARELVAGAGRRPS